MSDVSPVSNELRDAISSFGEDPSHREGPLGRAKLPDDRFGQATLEARSGPGRRLVGVLFACLFWNGIVSVFVVVTVRHWLGGQGSWLMTLFLIPFVLVGLGLLAGVVHAVLGLVSPRPTITVSHPVVALGETIEIEWRFSRRPSGLKSLAIALELRERARYRRGTDTVSEDKELMVLPIADVTDLDVRTGGTETITIPADAMHTFSAPSNAFYWAVSVKGDIPRWPDIDMTFELCVVPPGYAAQVLAGAPAGA